MTGIASSAMRYKTALCDDNTLRLKLIKLAKQHGHYGYCMTAELLRAEGWHVNHKKVERLWREEDV